MCYDVYFQCEKCKLEFQDPEKNIITCEEKSLQHIEAEEKARENNKSPPPPPEPCAPGTRGTNIDIQDRQKSDDCPECKLVVQERRTDYYPDGDSEDEGGR